MQGVLALFLLILGAGQLVAVLLRLDGLSLAGGRRWAGLALALALLAAGWLHFVPAAWLWLAAVPLAVLAVGLLLWGGSIIAPVIHPNSLYAAEHPAHGGCQRVAIPDGQHQIPGLLLRPPANVCNLGAGVCLVPGAGATKTFFKWRLVRLLLAEGFTVLTIDPPGHGDDRHHPLDYPDCLSTVPAAAGYLRQLPGLKPVGVIGISLGGALAIESLARQPDTPVAALVVAGTPISLNYTRRLFYIELVNTLCSRTGMSLFREMTARQVWQTWKSGGYRSRYNVSELLALLRPVANIGRLRLPLLLVYSRRDHIAPPEHARCLQQAAPAADLIESARASHVLLTLEPATNRQIVAWLRRQLT